MIDFVVSLILYTYALCLTGIKSWRTKLVTDRSIECDWEREYHVYEDMLKGNWRELQNHEMLSSAITVALFPYLIHRLTRLNAEMVFKIFPSFISALVPVFIYLIARQFLNVGYSTMASFYVLCTFFFLYSGILGRLGIALGFMSGVLYFLLTGNTLVASLLVVLVVASHYGTSHYLLYILTASWIIMMIITPGLTPNDISIFTVLAVLALSIFVWHRVIFKHTGDVMLGNLREALFFTSPTLDAPIYIASPDGSLIIRPYGFNEGKGKAHALFELEHRDPIVQVAFGRTWQYLNILQKVELVLSWLTVVLMIAGLILSILWMGITFYIILALVSFSAIVISVAIPHVSIYYGVARTYLTALILLAPCFVVGIEALANIMEVNGYVLGFIIVVMYGLCVSKVLRR